MNNYSKNAAARHHERMNVMRHLEAEITHPENDKQQKRRLFYALELASDRLLLAGDKEGFAAACRVLNSITLL